MSGTGAPGDRWQQVIKAFDPERNIRALAEMMNQAASASEQVVESYSTARPRTEQAGGGDDVPLRDALVELERSFARVYEAVGRFMVERPLGSAGAAGGAATEREAAHVAVIDGVGTTSMSIAGATSIPHCGELRRHDGATLPGDSVTILRSRSFDDDLPSFVVRVDVPDGTGPGVYHGQLLVEGLTDAVTPIAVTVVGEE